MKLIDSHPSTIFKAGDTVYVEGFYTGEGIIAAFDEGVMNHRDGAEIVLVHRKETGSEVIPHEWQDHINKELVLKYVGWYWEWIDIRDVKYVSGQYSLEEITHQLHTEVK